MIPQLHCPEALEKQLFKAVFDLLHGAIDLQKHYPWSAFGGAEPYARRSGFALMATPGI
jgi:hypothetical protein